MLTSDSVNHRVLIIDDTEAIHEDIRKVLNGSTDGSDALGDLEAALFGDEAPVLTSQPAYDVHSAFQGEEGYKLVNDALQREEPFAVAFVDMRMPPGWDGLRTIEEICSADPHIQIVICSAYADHTWVEICDRVGQNDRLLVLKKPFDPIEIAQLASTLTRKWSYQAAREVQLAELDALIAERTLELTEAQQAMKEAVEQRERMADELRLSQKLESVGQLAAGIAHEINTPIQYIGDSVYFLQECADELTGLVGGYQEAFEKIEASPEFAELVESIRDAEEEADLDFLKEQAPKACERAIRGIERVTEIVRAMKEFSHPPTKEKIPSDIRNIVANTLAVCRSEYKTFAMVVQKHAQIPAVLCHPGELGQVVLNLVINASHAVRDNVREGRGRGKIHVSTFVDGDDAAIRIEDNGMGIPEEVQHRIFDQFFTTKGVGVGTGQGLAMARQIIVSRHGGSIEFESSVGEGTTFVVRLPIRAADGEGTSE